MQSAHTRPKHTPRRRRTPQIRVLNKRGVPVGGEMYTLGGGCENVDRNATLCGKVVWNIYILLLILGVSRVWAV